eukprot:NODE_5913_length_626_cov_22.135182_g5513_i0.p1 GENE.NODE_5913_length_626_cov_22.135182_g5513_i0~~NODE_5913_length_626_cov_22.135182_g5513_i0.p1  ORF type:complete len:123 (-),score=12.97 NODE_5913_length_626_cov_22.135182_g5513_i0:89-457(-)
MNVIAQERDEAKKREADLRELLQQTTEGRSSGLWANVRVDLRYEGATDANIWLQDLEVLFRARQVPDRDGGFVAAAACSGAAREFFRAVEDLSDWEQVKRDLMVRFPVIGRDYRTRVQLSEP